MREIILFFLYFCLIFVITWFYMDSLGQFFLYHDIKTGIADIICGSMISPEEYNPLVYLNRGIQCLINRCLNPWLRSID